MFDAVLVGIILLQVVFFNENNGSHLTTVASSASNMEPASALSCSDVAHVALGADG